MDYHKITKTPPHPQGSVVEGLSPSKLRKMLNKKKKQPEDQPESSGSQLSEIDDDSAISGDNVENYKDVDVVSVDNRSKGHQFEFQKTSQKKPVVAPFSKAPPSKWDDAQKWIASPTSSRTKHDLKKNRQPITKLEVEDRRLVPYEEPDTKQIDSYSKSVVTEDTGVNLSRHDSALSIQNTTFVPPPSTARSVSMRDMGTEMTPIASQEPSRTGTPVGATTPSRSPSSSRPVTPERRNANSSNVGLEGGNRELSEKELQIKTRREIKALGTQLGKMNIAAWASKEEEDKDKDASSSLKGLGDEKTGKNTMEMRAAAWEDAEKAKYMARFKREEVKIEVWENHQKATTEAEMRRIEVEVERMRGGAHDRLMNKLAAARHKAEEKRAAAEAKRNREAARAEEQAGYIRQTGRIPSSFACYRWCC